MIRVESFVVRAAAVALLAGTLVACGHMPWGARSDEAPKAVEVLVATAVDGSGSPTFPQYWKRNTLVIDLQGAASTGQVTFKPRAGQKWPARLAFRVMPGTVRMMEVRADQRMIIPVTREGTTPVDIELLPGVYSRKAEQLTLQWGM